MGEISSLPLELAFYTLLLGILIGLFTSILGIGGGIFMVPLLPTIYGISLQEAVATSLFSIFLVTLFNTILFHREGAVRWSVGLWLGIPAATVAVFVPKLAVQLPNVAIQWVLIITLLFMAVLAFFNRNSLSDHFKKPMTAWIRGKCFLMGAVVGTLSGLSGMGGGLFFGPFVIQQKLIYSRELTPTISLTAMLTTTMGSLGYLLLGLNGPSYIHFALAGVLFVISSLSGVYFKKLQTKIPVQWKVSLIAFVLVIMATKVFWSWYYGLGA